MPVDQKCQNRRDAQVAAHEGQRLQCRRYCLHRGVCSFRRPGQPVGQETGPQDASHVHVYLGYVSSALATCWMLTLSRALHAWTGRHS